MSADLQLQLVVTHATRATDAEEAVAEQVRRQGYRLTGDHPRYRLHLDAAGSQVLAGGRLPESLGALLTDLAHEPALRSLGVAWQVGPAEPDRQAVEQLQVGDFIALAREGQLKAGVWYRLHAPAGYRCRPRG